MAAPATTYAADCEFWRNIMRNVVFTSDELAEALEEKSVYWNDDLQIIGTFVLKTIKQSANAPEDAIKMLPQYKDEEDSRFGNELFIDSVKNREVYRSYIDSLINVGNWDPERIAFMDIVIMTTAISELINYPAIPLAVTMNEYVEIANTYSAAKSGQFINGILYNVVNKLREEGKINK
jgi:N utilization substance protein B